MDLIGSSPGPSSARRDVITGIGVVSTLGMGVRKNWEAGLRGASAVFSIGSGIGGLATIEECHKTLLERGPDRVSPFFLVSIIINEAAGHVSIKYRSRGPNSATATARATG